MKTWEMLRDIREGETYEIASGECAGQGISLRNSDSYADKVLVWTESDGEGGSAGDQFAVTAHTLTYEWHKRTPATVTVDFAKAFAAYEKGARIKPVSWGPDYKPYEKSVADVSFVFRPEDIRGKWIVEGPGIESGEYWWE